MSPSAHAKVAELSGLSSGPTPFRRRADIPRPAQRPKRAPANSLAGVHELEPELLDLLDHAEQMRLIDDRPGQNSCPVLPIHPQPFEQVPEAIVELAANDNLVLGGGSGSASHVPEVRARVGEARRRSPR